MCLTSTEITKLIRGGEKGEGGMELGGGVGEGDYIPTRMTPALRWAAMKAILMFD